MVFNSAMGVAMRVHPFGQLGFGTVVSQRNDVNRSVAFVGR
jgi:hypothetical protein